jgi:hypothetical protein
MAVIPGAAWLSFQAQHGCHSERSEESAGEFSKQQIPQPSASE